MTDQTEQTQNSSDAPMIETTTTHKKARVRSMFLFVVLLLLASVATVGYWFLFIRGLEETDDAYAQGNQVAISSQVAGSVAQINVQNMDYVHEGDVLVVLNRKDRELAFNQAQEQLAQAVRNVQNLHFTVAQLNATKEAQAILVKKTQDDYKRQLKLAKVQATTTELLAHAKEAYEQAKASFNATKNQLLASEALLLKTPLKEQPAVKMAMDNMQVAWLNLQRTQILSPVTGYVAKRNVQVGESINVGRPLMAVIPAEQMWVEANFKETQLKDMRLGQEAKVTFDLYGDDVVFHGKVVGIDMGTGSAFSLLPAQNATGNWIKIVQRLPVRIALDAKEVAQHPLRLGLSALAKVDVSKTDGEVLRPAKALQAVYSTNVLHYDEKALNAKIEAIIQANIGKN